jgi:hypothetical protein
VPGNAVTKAEYFQAKAVECDKLADKAIDPEGKRMLLEAAEDWRWLAFLEKGMKL